MNAAPLLAARGVSRSFRAGHRRIEAIRDIDLDVAAGDRIALVGPSGCGKSTLLDLMCGLDRPTCGQVIWNGPGETPLGHAASLPQGGALLSWRTVRDNVAVALRIRGVGRRAAAQRSAALLDEFGLGTFAAAYPGQLSGGMRARVAFLRTVCADSPVIALDEPFAALDAITREGVQEWLPTALRDDVALLVVTHDVFEAAFLADRVVVLSPSPGRVWTVVDLPSHPRDRSWRAAPEFLAAAARIRAALEAAGG